MKLTVAAAITKLELQKVYTVHIYYVHNPCVAIMMGTHACLMKSFGLVYACKIEGF